MLTFPNCKINIGLSVTHRREDGYHDLETIFYPVKHLRDALEIVLCDYTDNATRETNILFSGRTVAGNEKSNLVWKAFELLKECFPDKIPSLKIYLHKAIPMGAGLGGGSADGAFMLRLLNDFCELNLTNEQLASFALVLGSDCPFFIYNTPQFAMGRGDEMHALDLDLSSYNIRIIPSDIHVSTRDAFAVIQPKQASFDLRNLSVDDIQNWKNYVVNDFEEPVFSMHPALKKNKQRLYAEGAVYASLSGSGSAVYGLFKKEKKNHTKNSQENT